MSKTQMQVVGINRTKREVLVMNDRGEIKMKNLPMDPFVLGGWYEIAFVQIEPAEGAPDMLSRVEGGTERK